MSVPGGRRGILAASGAAILVSVAVAALAPGPDRAPPVAAVPAALRTGGVEPGAPPLRRARTSVSILQIGDSHTAADFFTDAARGILQERFGTGGVGYLPAGTPHPGVRTTRLARAASAGWRYDGVRRSPRPELFGLSGYNATAEAAGETLSFASEAPVPYAAIQIDVRTGPEAGGIVVEVDGVAVLSASLAAETAGARMLEIRSATGGAAFRRMVVRTTEARPVTVSGVGIVGREAGLTYTALGVPGATIDLLGRYPERTLAEGLKRLAPDIVVLAFGTNEGFDAGLDPAAYERRYAAAIRAIRRAVPAARLVMIGPPQAERAPPGPAAAPPAEGTQACPGRPPQLDRVHAVQSRLAAGEGIPFWDWWGIMPAGCGASRWAAADPPLMAKDRIHFTKAGYRVGGQAFAGFLEPQVRALLRGDDAVSHH